MASTLPEEFSYLLNSVRSAKAVLLLGAGASRTGTNRRGLPVKIGSALAAELCKRAGFDYSNEALPEVVQACVGPRLSEHQFRDIIREEYTGCAGGTDLHQLFSYPWARAYTLNVDDTIERLRQLGDGRRTRTYNALIDHVVPLESTADLQLIHLNGVADKPEHGLIFSQDDYYRKLSDAQNYWYTELASDYHRFTPIIIGSSLNEPILLTELERVKEREGRSGAAFLVVPSKLSDIQKGILTSRNIVHLAMNLEQFVALLRQNLGAMIKASDTVKEIHIGITEQVVETLTQRDIETAMALRPVVGTSLNRELQRQRSSNVFDRHAQIFLQGAPPDWIIANSDVPIDLVAGEPFRPVLRRAIEEGFRLVVVLGMAGSGKSTLAMRTILQLAQEAGYVLYELSGEARNFADVFTLVQRLHATRRVLLYLDDLALYGDTLAVDLEKISGNQVVVVATARLSEWNDRFQRYLANVANPFELRRFEESDFEPLTNRLLRYVPAPAFRRATSEERLRRFRQSRSQLLIALREITESRRFDEVIEDEWSTVTQPSRRFLFYVAGVATIARVGIASHLASGIFRQRFPTESFDGTLSSLTGIVFCDRENRLRVRHEQYAEHIFGIEPLSEFLESVKSILGALARYEPPLTTRLTRNDASLFRWLLNNRSLHRRCSRRGQSEDGLAIYESFEKAFELDGHFWLQYGLYCRRLGKVDRAMVYLNKSVEAYPQNPYATHALADLKLRVAADLSCPSTTAQTYINEAVEELLKLDARLSSEYDIYPIVTLGTRHLQALIVRGKQDEARLAAKRYFDRAQALARWAPTRALEQLKQSLLLYSSTGAWSPIDYDEFVSE
jgi:hypothetical protein